MSELKPKRSWGDKVNEIKKSPVFWSVILFVVGVCGILAYEESAINLIFLPAWVFGLYNTFIFILAPYFKKIKPQKKANVSGKVAIFYMVKNDFDQDVFNSLLNLTYKDKEIFIIDDSTNEEIIKKLDSLPFKKIRRKERKGFKAGAINNAIKQIGDAFDYLLIVDSDEILPKDFIENTLPYFANEKVAFVQARHKSYNKETSWLKAMSFGVDKHWEYYQNYRNKYGFVPFLGHGAILDLNKIKEVGGFPEVVSEDLALSIELRNKGYYGVFAYDVVAYETFPRTYLQFRKRHKKWAMGTAELLKKYSTKLLFSKMSWFEKIDILLPTIALPMSVLLLIYSLIPLLNIQIPVTPLTITLTILTILAPNFPLISKNIKNLLYNMLTYMSVFWVSLLYTFKGTFTPEFYVTNTKESKDLTLLADVILSIVFIVLLKNYFSLLYFVTVLTPVLAHFFNNPLNLS